jgi:mevalonate kinase
MSNQFYSHGKLLLTGEYAVLDGAKSLAIPTKYGQLLEVDIIDELAIYWKSIDNTGKVWLETSFTFKQLANNNISFNTEVETTLFNIFRELHLLNTPLFEKTGFQFKSILEFDRDWGLGSSSTLINNLANWAEIDAYKLLSKTFGGSGYDIACAQHSQAIYYTKTNNNIIVEKAEFNPPFADSLYFVHLNKKQNSREGINLYKNIEASRKAEFVTQISPFATAFCNCKSLSEFQQLVNKHEEITSHYTQLPTVKELLFSDFKGSVKSLGAWGGDFILAAGNTPTEAYFSNKGYATIIPLKEMILP